MGSRAPYAAPSSNEATFFNVFDGLNFRQIREQDFLAKVQMLVNRGVVRFADQHVVFVNKHGLSDADLQARVVYENGLRGTDACPQYIDISTMIARYIAGTLTTTELAEHMMDQAQTRDISNVYFFTGSEVSEEIRNRGLTVNTPALDVVIAANNKLLVSELGAAGDIVNFDIKDEQQAIMFFNQFGKDVFIKKPLDGGSNGVMRIQTVAQLINTMRIWKQDPMLGPLLIMQRTIDDGEHDFADTCNVYIHICEDGSIMPIYPGPLMQEKNGIEHVGNKTYGISDQDAADLMEMGTILAEKLFEKTCYVGPAGFNFVKSQAGRVFMEVNARINGSAMLTDPIREFQLPVHTHGLCKPIHVKDGSYRAVLAHLKENGLLFNGKSGVYPLYPQGNKFACSVYAEDPNQVDKFYEQACAVLG